MRNNAEQYAREWALKTGKSEDEIYIPAALREMDNEDGDDTEDFSEDSQAYRSIRQLADGKAMWRNEG